MIERLNGRVAIAVAAAGLLLVALVGWFGVVSPQRSKAAELSVKIDDAETQLAVAQALVEGPALMQSKAELATLKKAIPDEAQMSAILRQLSKASARSRVRITGITPGAAVASGASNVVPINVTVEGRYFGLRNFLRLLRASADLRGENVKASGRLFAVDSIQFNGGDTTSNLVNATLAVTAFAFPEAAAPPAAAGTLSAPDDAEVAEAAGK